MAQNRSNPIHWGKRPKGASACSLSRWQRRQLSRRASAFRRGVRPLFFEGLTPLDQLFSRYIKALQL